MGLTGASLVANFLARGRRQITALSIGLGIFGIGAQGVYTHLNDAWNSGGDNFPFVSPGYDSNNFQTPILRNEGDVSLYDVTMWVRDDQKAEEALKNAGGRLSFTDIQQRQWVQSDLGNINPHSRRLLANLAWDMTDPGISHRSFTFRYNAKNGFVREQFGWRRLSPGKYTSAFRVVRETIDGEALGKLEEVVEPGYPLDPNGEPEW
jgi:hypothetical protein